MVFEWFLGSKRKEAAFVQFQQILKKLEYVDLLIEKLMDGTAVQEKTARRVVSLDFHDVKELAEIFREMLTTKAETIRLYIVTSVDAVDYLSGIEIKVAKLLELAGTVSEDLHRDDFEQFIVACSDIVAQVHQLIVELESDLRDLYKQSKMSLGWLSQGGSRNIDFRFFRQTVNALGGTIDDSGRSHLVVRFKLFEFVTAIGQRGYNEIAGGTFRGQIDRSFNLKIKTNSAKIAAIKAKGITVEQMQEYFKNLFLLGDESFRAIFVTKYKDLFSLS